MRGIYGIKVNNCFVYVGQAVDINERIRTHLGHILNAHTTENKYLLLHTCGRTHPITFWLLEEIKETDKLNEAEYKWIKALQPCLNSTHMSGLGRRITANEFYNIVLNEEHDVEGASEWRYKPKKVGPR